MEDLADLDGQEAKLCDQDRDLDRLGSELNSHLADRKGELKVQEQAMSSAQANLRKVKALGAKGVCPPARGPGGPERSAHEKV